MSERVDVRCYVIVDPASCAGRDPVAVARAAARGGATIIQLRDKRGDIPAMLALARALKRVLAQTGVPLVINDRVGVALAADADGVHVGQNDLPAWEVRELMGDDAIVGLSHRRMEEVESSPVEVLSYAAIGGIFPTTSKQQNTAGLEAFAAMARAMRARAPDLPIVGIAGITVDNAASVIRAGADGVAVISAVCAASDPEAATRELRAVVDAALTARTGKAGP